MTATIPLGTLKEIAPTDITPHPDNPRRNATADDTLMASIASAGILEPLLVRWLQWTAADGAVMAGWQLLAGHRRLDGATRLGLMVVPVMVLDVDDHQATEVLVVENMARKDLDPIEQATGLQLLADRGLKPKDVAAKLGWSADLVKRRLALLTLPETVQAEVRSGGLSLDLAADLASLPPTSVADIVASGRYRNSYTIEAERDRLKRKRLMDTTIRTLTKEGRRTKTLTGLYEARSQDHDLLANLGLDATLHAFEPCHLIGLIPYGGSVDQHPMCDDLDSHQAEGTSNLKVTPKPIPVRPADLTAEDTVVRPVDTTGLSEEEAADAVEAEERRAAQAKLDLERHHAQVAQAALRQDLLDHRVALVPKILTEKIPIHTAARYLWDSMETENAMHDPHDAIWQSVLVSLGEPEVDQELTGDEGPYVAVIAYRDAKPGNAFKALLAYQLSCEICESGYGANRYAAPPTHATALDRLAKAVKVSDLHPLVAEHEALVDNILVALENVAVSVDLVSQGWPLQFEAAKRNRDLSHLRELAEQVRDAAELATAAK